MLSVEDSTGVTNYIYDETTQEFLGIDYGNGGSPRYEYDNFGRIEQVKVQADPLSAVYTTSYEYDPVGNLIKVTDPNGGETVMIYDEVNRLTSRNLPNGITTTYSYIENTDWVKKITHTAADGTIVASAEYIREGIGEPVKIIREDNSYVELDYDDSLRVIKETYFDDHGVQIEQIEYSYDAEGNRLSVSNGEAEGIYFYENLHQLSSIDTDTGTETYTYDDAGRIASISRDGEIWNLAYNTADLITSVTDAAGNVIVEYEYDSNGRRVEATDSTGQRNYLVAPMGNSDLESPHLITDENGDLISAYVYGGTMPLLRLDESGNPVYYLTDAMGSTIGLADGSGVEVAEFDYDSFGNLRRSVGNDLGVTGGDFRFQGQWLESSTDLYHMRARYYDPESGRFVSRDPVEVIEYEPQSSNPYQFVYNNPHIYSDPSGMFTITSVNASIEIRRILDTVKAEVIGGIRKEVIDEAHGVVTDIAIDLLNNLLPADLLSIKAGSLDSKSLSGTPSPWEERVTNTTCNIIKSAMPSFFGLDTLWFQPSLNKRTGEPVGNGFNPSPIATTGCGIPFVKKTGGLIEPELIVKHGEPTDTSSKSYLVLEVKTAIGGVEFTPGKQFDTITNYAKDYMFVPTVLYVSLKKPTGKQVKRENQMKQKAVKKGVILEVIDFGI
ncbi:RHS repeat domain-containing protein [Oscillatoria salina]|uniref:RHS repeat domain-containing protein n=1 Tax=Oscillatoria salina TaxID=331517 RepID=UPI001CCFF083|nr:RHS repeat-associated core domain-containing protein [Oscillatoria salina]MBZ8182744.1 RHS repeat-associated core domain-containing protein [Oscillatoria salina IIICB1]